MRAAGSLRARITLAAVAALAVAGAIAGFLIVKGVERDGRSAVDHDLRERVERIVQAPGPPPGVNGAPRGFRGGPPPDRGPEPLLAGSGSYVQVAQGGQIVEQRGDVPSHAPGVPNTDGLSTVHIGGHSWRALTVSPPGVGAARFEFLTSLQPVEDRAAHTRKLVIVFELMALALTALAAWGFTTLAVRPLARLQAGAARVSGAEDLGTSLPDDDGPTEVRSLAHTLNEMLARLRASTEAMERALSATRRFAADAGHEMRTPLTGMRANLDTLDRNPGLPEGERHALVREILGEHERIVHLLGGLQALARGDAAESLPRESVELGDLIDAAVYAADRRHPGITYELHDRVDGATISGWDGGLRLLVDNLLDNAAVHGRSNGHVDVRMQQEGAAVVVRVDDDGPGIPAEERASVVEPFARGSRATASGTGLGLAIVAQQVALHGGSLRLDDSPRGGLAVEVRLPAEP
jgi:signal transduction histidine kinase